MGYLWIPALLIGLTCLEGIIEFRTWTVLRQASNKMPMRNIVIILLVVLLNLGWYYFHMPITLYCVLFYLIRILHYTGEKRRVWKELFYINLGYVNYLALFLITIGTMALIQHTSMSDMLKNPLWRMTGVAVCTMTNLIETGAVLRKKSFSDSLNAEAESEEGRLLMAFLKFCTVYLLLDSLLCFSHSEPVYTALFLIGSCVIIVSVLILYLWYIGKLLQNSRLREEYIQLEAQLESHKHKTGTLRQMTDRDTLTQAYSRRYGIRKLEEYLETGQEVSIAFLDLDHLKIINDREGHQAGDLYLIGFVKKLRKQLGENGTISRLGGDEFMILLPGYMESAAKQCIDQIRSVMEEGEPAFFFSFGISSCPASGQSCVEKMIREADRGMYQDKRRRR